MDFAASLIVVPGTRVGADLLVSHDIDRLGLIVRDGRTSPYVYGPNLGLRSNTIKSTLLQRLGCLPVCRAAAVQYLVELLMAVPTDACPLKAESETAAEPPVVALAGRLQLWLSGHGDNAPEAEAERAHPEPDAETLVSDLMALITQGGCINIIDQGIVRRTLEVLKERHDRALAEAAQPAEPATAAPEPMTPAPAREPIDGQDWVTAVNTVLADLHTRSGEFHLAKRMAIVNQERRDVVIQGAGDLSFNEWNVAYLRGGQDGNDARTLIPEGEPYSQRRYRCIVKWRDDISRIRAAEIDRLTSWAAVAGLGSGLGRSLAFLELEFSPGRVHLPDAGPDGQRRGERVDISDLVQFALFGKSVLWAGQVVDKHTIVHQFRDVRHVFRLPNLNRKRKNEPQRPRFFFGRPAEGDFWLLEAALIANPVLLRLACLAPIVVPLEDLGTDRMTVDMALVDEGYESRSPTNVSRPGDFAWEGQIEEKLRIFLRPASYPCNIVGIGGHRQAGGAPSAADCTALYLLAWGHDFERGEYRIWEDCAEALRAVGARYALVLDEGQDVFQAHIAPNRGDFFRWDFDGMPSLYTEFMPVAFAFDQVGEGKRWLKRTALRASIAFWSMSGDG